jgi:hypothetical protein
VRLTDELTGEKMVLSYNRWLARDMDDGDLCRELPVIRTGKPIPMCMYICSLTFAAYILRFRINLL